MVDTSKDYAEEHDQGYVGRTLMIVVALTINQTWRHD
jgi:hypothetical protein